ncbi:HPGD [Mytilus coruscus]|uniref:15-hydroxyprostaglandin dehydrogenase [NAD(+)] n=1 Tax=Mytilus coruscus TaxID=42192 RepID=A0A6J8BBQ5_MYTCO|nr:HPGD [Mytilus coruscus]
MITIFNMTGKVAVVTGAARGLGRAFTEALLKRGDKVCFCDVDNFGDDNVQFLPCDVRKDQEFTDFFNRVIQKYNTVDIMINNAGILNENQWRKTVDINLTAVIHGSLLAMEHMRNRSNSGGLILNVSSLAGVMPVSFCPAYTASKHGVIGFSRSWALQPEVRKNRIRIACLCPSFTDTDIIKGTYDSRVHGPELARRVMNSYELMVTDRVTEAFLRILDDLDNNGKVMMVTPTRGNDNDNDNETEPTISGLCRIQDKQLLAKLSSGDVIAQKMKYHPSCLAAVYRERAKKRQTEAENSCTQEKNMMKETALAELVTYFFETRRNSEESVVFRLADLAYLYEERLTQLGSSSAQVHSTRLRDKLLQKMPELEAHTKGRDVLLMFKKDI